MISWESTGSFKSTEAFLEKIQKFDITRVLHSHGQEGVAALSRATPVETGLAAHSWGYEVTRKKGLTTIAWTNYDVENGFPVVVMLQYGHGTGTGGFVRGIDFINPAIRPVMDRIAEDVWKAVTSA